MRVSLYCAAAACCAMVMPALTSNGQVTVREPAPAPRAVAPAAPARAAVREERAAVREDRAAVREDRAAVRDDRAVGRDDRPATGDNAGTTRVSDLMDMELVTEKGDKLGVVKDFVIDNASGQVRHVVVATDDGDYRAIPWKTLALYQGESPKDSYFILGMEQDRFQKAPAIPQKTWTNYSAPAWTAYTPQVNKYYADVQPARPAAVRRADRAERRAERAVNP